MTEQRRAGDRPVRPTRLEVDLEALRENFAQARKLAAPASVLAVVKANAYGHGAIEIARALDEAGAELLGVALVEEGVELRRVGVKAPILVLGGAYEGGYETLLEHRLTPTVFRVEHLEGLHRAARGAEVDVHLKLDTGMGRIGVAAPELPAFLEEAKRFPGLRIDGLASHFANADLADAELTRLQIERFRQGLALLAAAGIHPRWRHLANSAGVLALPEVRDGLRLNLVRPGIMLYGLPPAEWLQGEVPLRPVGRWRTAVTHVKTVAAGTPISYGSTWVAKRESTLATLPVGYADGYSRRYSSRASVLVRGQRAPIAGRVCMDMCMVDVTDVPGVSLGDEVVLMGRQGGEEITAEELAGLAETIHYEIVCGVSARVPRVTLG